MGKGGGKSIGERLGPWVALVLLVSAPFLFWDAITYNIRLTFFLVVIPVSLVVALLVLLFWSVRQKTREMRKELEYLKKIGNPDTSKDEKIMMEQWLNQRRDEWVAPLSNEQRKRLEWFKAEVKKLKPEECTNEKLEELQEKSRKIKV